MSLTRINYGRGHGYKLDGRKVEGVTTLLKNGLPKPGLMYWSARAVAEYVADADAVMVDELRSYDRDGMIELLKGVPWRTRDAAAVRGTDVHKLAERLSKGERVDVPDHLAGHVDACVKFFNDWRPSVVLSETPVASRRWRYAGTLDLVADLPDGRRSLIDYKTGASGIWPETALQQSAYRHADFYIDGNKQEMPVAELGINCSYAVWLRADGYDVIPVDTTCVGAETACRAKNDRGCGTAPVFDTFLHIAYVAKQVESEIGLPSWVHDAEPWAAAAVPA